MRRRKPREEEKQKEINNNRTKTTFYNRPSHIQSLLYQTIVFDFGLCHNKEGEENADFFVHHSSESTFRMRMTSDHMLSLIDHRAS